MAAQMRREGDEGRNAQTVGATTGLIDHKVSPLLPLSLSSWLDSAGAPKLFHELHIHYNAYWSQGRSVPHRHYGREIRVGCRTRRAWVDKTFIFSQLSYSRRLYTPRPISTCMWAAWFHLIWCNSTSTGTESVALEKLFRFYWRLKGKAIRRKKKKNPQLFLPPCTAKFREREMGGIAQKDDPFYHDVCVFSDAVPLGRENWPARDGHLLFWLSRRSSRPIAKLEVEFDPTSSRHCAHTTDLTFVLPYVSQFVGDPFLDLGSFGLDLFGVVQSHLALLVHLTLQPVNNVAFFNCRLVRRHCSSFRQWIPRGFGQLLLHGSQLDSEMKNEKTNIRTRL